MALILLRRLLPTGVQGRSEAQCIAHNLTFWCVARSDWSWQALWTQRHANRVDARRCASVTSTAPRRRPSPWRRPRGSSWTAAPSSSPRLTSPTSSAWAAGVYPPASPSSPYIQVNHHPINLRTFESLLSHSATPSNLNASNFLTIKDNVLSYFWNAQLESDPEYTRHARLSLMVKKLDAIKIYEIAESDNTV